MSNHNLYSKYKITSDDYKYYNTYFVEDYNKKVKDAEIVNRLKFINDMLNKQHSTLSDGNILKIHKKVKKGLAFDRRFLLIAGISSIIMFYFGIQYMKPKVGISSYYKVAVVSNNPWEILLVAIIMIVGWYYEKKTNKKNTLSKTKNYIIAEIEEVYFNLKNIQTKKKHNKKRKKPR